MGMPQRDLREWLDRAGEREEAEARPPAAQLERGAEMQPLQAKAAKRTKAPAPTPSVRTRLGRDVKPPERFDVQQELIREKELKAIAKATKLSKLEATQATAPPAQEQAGLEEVAEEDQEEEETEVTPPERDEDEIPPPDDLEEE